jgi:transcription antitermination protein NusB
VASRHRAREYALQMLYQAEASGAPIAEILAGFWRDVEVPPEVRDFAGRLAGGTASALGEIDGLLTGCLDNWRLERLAIVDRNVLRMAVYELLHEPETPPIVVIDEAIEVAKRFGGEDSGQFVNGILDALRKRLRAPAIEEPGPAGGSGCP